MLKNIASIFHKKIKTIEDELVLRSKIDKVLTLFVKNEIIKNRNINYTLSYTISRDIIKVKTDNKLIAQEIALRIRQIEEQLRKDKVGFNKVLI